MKKKAQRIGLDDAVSAKNQQHPVKDPAGDRDGPQVDQKQTVKNEYRGSAINLRVRDWDLLRSVASARWATGSVHGRSSMSKVLESLIAEARERLTKEANNYQIDTLPPGGKPANWAADPGDAE